jgi:hypothetical protein
MTDSRDRGFEAIEKMQALADRIPSRGLAHK